MDDNLLSLRLLLVSHLAEDHELFRQAAVSAATPIEIMTANSADAAHGKLAGADLIYLDAGLSGDEIKAVICRGARGAKSAVHRAVDRAGTRRRIV